MKNTQNIYIGFKKYMLTQFQSIELQILYKCSHNNPGMSYKQKENNNAT